MGNERKIGISGGTFDPVHFGHLLAAEYARCEFGLDKVLFVPLGLPPHKNPDLITDSESRFEMVQLAVRGNPGFEVSRIELDRPGFTYTVDTLEELRARYGPETRLLYIVGADVVGELLTWKDWARVFSICEFIAVIRPESGREAFLRQVERLRKEYGAKIHPLDMPPMGISSSLIRSRVREGKSIRYMVPAAVEEYIYGKGLYRGGR